MPIKLFRFFAFYGCLSNFNGLFGFFGVFDRPLAPKNSKQKPVSPEGTIKSYQTKVFIIY